ncbi:Asp-tRNA(Asn)/Glu-tRNA(Gln) amidotransferase subunit GatC [bacterium]|nr:Asp-tRNA(Asn)/Glu-tRNA(Gln) amidotransferase subunit GatC [bacterium]
MSLSTAEVKHIAKLAAFKLNDEQIEHIKGELNAILDYVAQLQEVNTEGVPPTSHVHGVTNVFREDVSQESLPVEALERNAPDFADGGFRVPKIIG